MQVEMDHVKAHIARTHHPHDRIQVCAVVVVQPASVVDDPGDLKDILVKDADCVRIGEHQARGVLTDRCTQLFQIDTAFAVRGDADHLVPDHRRARRVGSVCRVRHDDLGAFLVPARFVVRLNQHQAGEFPVCARCGLEGHPIHAGDLAEQLFRHAERFQTSLHRMCRLERMDLGKARQAGHLVVDFGVIFHRAGAERIKPVIDPMGALHQRGIMAADVHLRNLGKMELLAAPQRFRQFSGRDIQPWQDRTAAALSAPFKNQFHVARTSWITDTSLSICALVFISVTHQRIPPSTG